MQVSHRGRYQYYNKTAKPVMTPNTTNEGRFAFQYHLKVFITQWMLYMYKSRICIQIILVFPNTWNPLVQYGTYRFCCLSHVSLTCSWCMWETVAWQCWGRAVRPLLTPGHTQGQPPSTHLGEAAHSSLTTLPSPRTYTAHLTCPL